jgi:hypothetical protein
MLSKNIFLNILNRGSVLIVARILLGPILETPCWATDIEPIAHVHTAKSPFVYDLNHLGEAQQVVAQVNFLPENICSFFERGVKTYDRREYQYFDFESKSELLSNLISYYPFARIFSSEGVLAQLELEHPECSVFKKQVLTEVESIYEPYLENVQYSINKYGNLNTDFLDAFFYHLLGVGIAYECSLSKEEVAQLYTYSQDNVTGFLQKLQEVEFLRNLDLERLLSLKESYSAIRQLDQFNANEREKLEALVIAGGHIGLPGIESISRYKNTLSIDLSPLELPDVISDINNPALLERLKHYYTGQLNSINDTSNFGDFTILQPDTIKDLAVLLRPGGCLIGTLNGKQEPINKLIADDLEQYGFKAIYSDEYTDTIIALEKQ